MDFLTIQPFYEVVKNKSSEPFQIPSSDCTSSELLQNCDLPPPIKLFSPVCNDATTIASLGDHQRGQDIDIGSPLDDHELQRALQLSQTRARRAEKEAQESNIRTEQINSVLLKDSLRLHAATWSVRQLELEISLLKRQQSSDEEVDNIAGTRCLQDLALCLGIAGAGFMLGRYFMQSFPFF